MLQDCCAERLASVRQAVPLCSSYPVERHRSHGCCFWTPSVRHPRASCHWFLVVVYHYDDNEHHFHRLRRLVVIILFFLITILFLPNNTSAILLLLLLLVIIYIYFFCCGAATQRGSWPPRFWCFLDHKQRRTTVGRTPLDEWSTRRRDLYLTTHNTHNRQTSMPPVGFEPTISAGERSQTYTIDRAATGTGICR